MAFYDYFYGNIGDVYASPDIVTLAFTVLVFAVCYQVLVTKGMLGKNRSLGVFISVIISLMFLGGFSDLQNWLAGFNILVTILVVIVFLYILLIFLRSIKGHFRGFSY